MAVSSDDVLLRRMQREAGGRLALALAEKLVAMVTSGIRQEQLASVSGCTYSGSLRPRSDTNTYDMQVTFSGGTCSSGSVDLAGISYMDADGRSLTMASLGFAFQGSQR